MATPESPARAVATPTSSPSRLVALDALRGFDMFWIIGADALVYALGRMNDGPVTGLLVRQLTHQAWEGFAFYDLIFPLFVFIVGVSLVFSLPRLLASHGRAGAVRRIVVRTVLLFALGLLYNGGLAREWPEVRIAGVLQRIALAYLAAALLLVFLRPRVVAWIGGALLVGYWAVMTFVPIRDVTLTTPALETRLGREAQVENRRPSPEFLAQTRTLFDATTTTVRGRFEPGLNVANHLDFVALPGRKWEIYWDPEGLLSTLPAIATCLLGVFAGFALRRTDWTAARKLAGLGGGGGVALALGGLWGWQFPVIKNLWTSSYVLVAGGWSLLLLAAFYYAVEVRGWRRWCAPFVWIGMNPITLYLATSLVGFHAIARRFAGGDVHRFFEENVARGAGELVIALVALALMLLLARFLYRRGIFLRV